MSQTLAQSNSKYLKGALLAEQFEQTTWPQALQWCLRTKTVNSTVHFWHIETRRSGTQIGGATPILHSILWSLLKKVAFLLLWSSIAVLRASNQLFRSRTVDARIQNDLTGEVKCSSVAISASAVVLKKKIQSNLSFFHNYLGKQRGLCVDAYVNKFFIKNSWVKMCFKTNDIKILL